MEVSTENDGVMSWSSVENKNDNSYLVKRLTPDNTYHPTVKSENGVKSILFPGNVGQKMTNDYFKESPNLKNFNVISFINPPMLVQSEECISMV